MAETKTQRDLLPKSNSSILVPCAGIAISSVTQYVCKFKILKWSALLPLSILLQSPKFR